MLPLINWKVLMASYSVLSLQATIRKPAVRAEKIKSVLSPSCWGVICFPNIQLHVTKWDLCNYLVCSVHGGHSAKITPYCCSSDAHEPPNCFCCWPPFVEWASVTECQLWRLKITNLKNLCRKWQYIAWIMYRWSDSLVTNFWLNFKADPLRYFESKLTFIK